VETAKDTKGAKKPAEPKRGGASKLDEITDNRPRIVNYERDCAAESGGLGLEVTEDVAIKFSEALLNL